MEALRKFQFTLALIACIALGIGAALWVSNFMASLTSYRSPLRSDPPPAGSPLGERLTRRVVIILVDALRLDTSLDFEVMPHLGLLRQQGASARMHSRPPSYSQPGYSVLLTGAWPEISDGPAINIPYEEIYPFTQDNLFSAAHRAGLRTAVSGYYWFEKLIPASALDSGYFTPGEDQSADHNVMQAAIPWLQDPGAYGLILIHIDQVDFAGHHEGGPQDPRWNEAAKRADRLIARTSALLDATQDTLLVVSDHGQIARGGHGGNERVVLTEPFLLWGAGVKPGDYGDVYMVDVAPTVAALLGLNIPATSQGRVLTELLVLTDQQTALTRKAWEEQQGQLLAGYREAIGRSRLSGWIINTLDDQQLSVDKIRSVRLAMERVPRAAVVLIILMVTVFLLIRLGKGEKGWMMGGALVFVALFHLGYSVLGGKTYSLSSVNSAGGLLASIGLGSVLPAAIGLLVAVAGNRAQLKTPRQVFNLGFGYTWACIFILSLPVGLSYALNGLLVSWTLPEFTSAFLSFMSLIQITFVVFWGLILSGLISLAIRLIQSVKRSDQR